MRQKGLVFEYLQLIVSFSHSTWVMRLFVILTDAITVSTITVDCKFRNFFKVVEAATKTQKVLHLYFLIEFNKRVVKLRLPLSLVLFGDVSFFYGAGIFKLPISSWVNFDGFFFYFDSSVK